METSPARYYEFNEYKVDARRRVLTRNGERVPVSARIFDLLLVLVRNEGRILGHDELLDLVWEGAFVEQSNLKKSISSLRQTLGEDPNEGLFIKTVPRRGYIFVAEVRTIAADDSAESGEMGVVADFDEPAEQSSVVVVSSVESPLNLSVSASIIRRPVALLFVGLAAVGLFAAAFYFWRSDRSPAGANDVRLESVRLKKLTTSGNIVLSTLSPDGKTIVFVSFDASGKQSLSVRRLGQNNDVQLVPPAEVIFGSVAVSPDNNSVYYSFAQGSPTEALYRISMSGGTPRKLADNLSSTVTFSPDGKRLAFVRDTAERLRRLLIINAEDGSDEREIYSVSDNHKLIEPRWSPDGARFLFVMSDVTDKGRVWSIATIPAVGGEVRQLLTPQTAKVYAPSWLGNGGSVVYCAELTGTRQTQVWRLSITDGSVTRLTNDVTSYENVVPSADGGTLVAMQTEKTGDLWNLNTTLLQNLVRLTDSHDFVGSFAVLPDGRILAEYTENGQNGLRFVSSDGSSRLPLFEQINGERTPSVTPDKQSILFVTRRSGTQEIWRADLDGRNPRQLSDEKSFVLMPRQTIDGSTIFFQRYDGATWRLVKMASTGGAVTAVGRETTSLFSLSPDGKTYAVSYLNDQRRRWMVAIRKIDDNSVQREFEIEALTTLEWLPDGKGLIFNSSETFRDGGNLMLQPVDGGAPKILLETKNERVFFAGASTDPNKLFVTRGQTISNIVMITTATR